jgi:hypothetical protein
MIIIFYQEEILTKPINFAKNFKAHQEKWKGALIKQAQKTMEQGARDRKAVERMAKVKKEDQE